MSELKIKPVQMPVTCNVCKEIIPTGENAIFDLKDSGFKHPKCESPNNAQSFSTDVSTDVSTDYLYSGYEDKSNDLITKFALEENNDEKLE